MVFRSPVTLSERALLQKELKIKMRSKNQRIAILGLLVGLMLLLGFTPVGNISIGPANITLMGFPVIIGTLFLGMREGLLLGFLFGFFNFLKTFIAPSALTAPLLLQARHWFSPVLYFVLMILPRVLVSVVVWIINRTKLVKPLRYGAAAVAGSLTNTIGFLGLMWLFFHNDIALNYGISPNAVGAMLAGLGISNGLIEAAVCALCSPIVCALDAGFKHEG